MDRVCYLNLNKALRDGYVLDRNEFFKRYGDNTTSSYRMMRGTPLVRNIDGFLIYESDIPNLITGPTNRGFYYHSLRNKCTIIFKWRRYE